ncbi:oligosaccharide flippase family protein [Aeromonas veronii]
MKFIKKNEISNNIIALAFVQFANYISPLLILPYLSRVLGVDGFGVIAIAMSLCGIAMIITDYGFGLSAPYWLAKNRARKNDVARYIGAVFTVKFILFLVCACVISIYFKLSNVIPREKFIHLAILGSIFFQTFQPSWFFLGIEKVKNVTFFMVISKLSYLVLVFLFVKNSSDVVVVLCCYAVSNLFATSFGIYFIYKEKYWVAFSSCQDVWAVLKEGGHFFASRLAVGVYTSASTFLVGSFVGAGAAALYGCAEKLYQAGQNLSSPVSQILYPYLARTGNKNVLYKTVGIFIIPLSIGISGCIYYSETIITIIFGPEFRSATELLQIFLITLVVNFIGVNFGYPAFASIGRVDIANNSVIFAAVLQLLSISILYINDVITAKNICISVLAVELIVALIRVIFFVFMSKKS